MVKPQRYNSLGGRQAYKPYSLYEDEKLDTKLYTKEEVADQMACFSTECSIGDEAPHSLFESSSSRTRFRGDDHPHNDGFRFEGRIEDEGKQEGNSLVHHHSSSLPTSSSSDSLSVIEFGMDSQPPSYFKPPRKVDNVAPPRHGRRVFQRNNHADNHHHGDDQQEFEEGRKALNFDFTPKPRLSESKRMALKAFYNSVQKIESNLKKPLQIYLKENEGNGFIGKFTNGNDSFRSKHKEEYAPPPSRFNSMMDRDPYHAEMMMMMMERERRFCNPFINDSISCVPSNIRFANRRMEEMNRMEEQRYFFEQERRRMGRRMDDEDDRMDDFPRMERYYGMQYSLVPSPPPQDDSPLILEDVQDDSSPLLIDMSTMCDEEDRDFNFQDGH